MLVYLPEFRQEQAGLQHVHDERDEVIAGHCTHEIHVGVDVGEDNFVHGTFPFSPYTSGRSDGRSSACYFFYPSLDDFKPLVELLDIVVIHL